MLTPPSLTPNSGPWSLPAAKSADPAKQRAAFDSDPQWFFRKQQCLHCSDPACVTACPTGALSKLDNGIVYIDQSICAGCKYCVEVCPFSTPHPDHKSGTAKKCRMCLDRVENGLEPACATACPTGAVCFGPREAMLEKAKERIKALKTERPGMNPYLYGEKELGGLGVLTLLPENDPELLRLPKDPKLPTHKIMVRWLMGLVPGFLIFLAIWKYFRKCEPAAAESGRN